MDTIIIKYKDGRIKKIDSVVNFEILRTPRILCVERNGLMYFDLDIIECVGIEIDMLNVKDLTDEPKLTKESIISKIQQNNKQNKDNITIPVKFKPGEKIYYKRKDGTLKESTIKSVEPLYVHETPEGDKCIFYDNFIGVIIFPCDVVGG